MRKNGVQSQTCAVLQNFADIAFFTHAFDNHFCEIIGRNVFENKLQ